MGSKMSTIAFSMWVLIPPFAQPVSMLLGPVFIAIESPWLGRVYAMFVLSSAAAPVVVTLWLIIHLGESWVFDLFEMLFMLALKVALFYVAQFHVANLEASRDLGFANVDQA